MNEDLKKYIKTFLTKIYNEFGLVFNDDIIKMEPTKLDNIIREKLREKSRFYSHFINSPKDDAEFENATEKMYKLYKYYNWIKDSNARETLMNNIILEFNQEKKIPEDLDEKFEKAFKVWCDENPVGVEKNNDFIFLRENLRESIVGNQYTRELIRIRNITRQITKKHLRVVGGDKFAQYFIIMPTKDGNGVQEVGADSSNISIFAQIDEKRMKTDKEYRRYVLEVLLSDEAIKLANIFTGGYVGTPVFDEETGKYTRELSPEIVDSVKSYVETIRDEFRDR